MSAHAFIAGAYEHPTRRADAISLPELHADVALGALADAGLTLSDVDGYFCGAEAPGVGGFSMAEYLGLDNLRHMDTTETGGSSYLLHVQHAAQAIAAGSCDVALITLADRPVADAAGSKLAGVDFSAVPEHPFLPIMPPVPVLGYGMTARRHMHLYGTTSEQLAWVKVAASYHAQHNPHAKLKRRLTVEDVLASPLVADPLHRDDCCVMTDGGGALIVVREEIARTLKRPLVRVKGSGAAYQHRGAGRVNITASAGVRSGAEAFAMAGVGPADIAYASIYDSFTITVIIQLEDLGFCDKGAGGAFVADGKLISGQGPLAVNTDGGGLCSNHPGNKGGMTKIIEAVRQCRGEAHPAVQVPRHELVLAHGTGGLIASQHMAATLIMEAL